jgi:hypothetical protein
MTRIDAVGLNANNLILKIIVNTEAEMKIYKTYFILFLFAISAACGSNEENKSAPETTQTPESNSPKFKRYNIEKGIVEYELSGSRTGKEILYFDNWGMREATFTNAEISISGFSIKENKITILDGEWTYNIDLDKKTGSKIKTPLLEELIKAAGDKDLGEFGEEMLKKMGGKKIGKDEVLGKTCDIWEIQNLNTRSWVWNWITLKTEAKLMGVSVIITATKISPNVSVPEEKFKIPAGITITEGVDPGSILNKLKGNKK